MSKSAKVLIMMADYGHDPTETAAPWAAFKEAGFDVQFATEAGKSPCADEKMLSGLTQKLLGSTRSVVRTYWKMKEDSAAINPLSWTDPSFSLDQFDLVFFPGGHDKAVRQIIDSPIVHKHVLGYFPLTKKPSHKAVAAVCHGVMVLSESMREDGKSILHDVTTTTLPSVFESGIYTITRPFLGAYYKTYGAKSETTEQSVRKKLADPSKQFKGSIGLGPFVVEDEAFNYVSARFPGDVAEFSERIVEMVKKNKVI